MKLFAVALFCAAVSFADEPADRASIENVINSLKTAKPVSALFTADADSDLDRLNAIDRRMANAANQTWSELTAPRLVIQSVRFLTPDVALVNATETQSGSVLTQRVPVLFVMKKDTTGWKIASLRVLTSSGAL